MSDNVGKLQVQDSKGKLIEHLAVDLEEQAESGYEAGTAYETQRVPKLPDAELPAPPEESQSGHTGTGLEIVGQRTSSVVELSPGPRKYEEPLQPEGIRSRGHSDHEMRGEPVEMSDTVFKLLEDFEEHIEGCRRLPMTDKVLVSEEALLDYVDRIRSLLPEELRQARMMVKDREHLLDEARVEAERVLAETSRRIEEMIKESEVVKRAETAAEEIVAQSRRVAHEIRANATQYADNILSNLEATLEQNLSVIRRGREELGQLKKDRQQAVNG